MSTAARMMWRQEVHGAGGAGGSAYKAVSGRVCRQVYYLVDERRGLGSGDSEAVEGS